MFDILKDLLSIIAKSLFSIIVLFILAKFMGKKQISQLSLFDYIISISIGSVAAASSVDKSISILDGTVSLIVWALFPIIVSIVTLHSMKARQFLEGSPIILIQNGKIIEKNLKKAKISINDLLEKLRGKNVFSITDVNYAILENNGLLSVLLKSQKRSVTPSDMCIKTPESSLNANIIVDGKLLEKNMVQMNISEAWLLKELRKKQIQFGERGASCNLRLKPCSSY